MDWYGKGMNYALAIIMKKRYTKSQITKKLDKYFQKQDPEKLKNVNPQDLVEQIIIRLEELNYINDLQYTADFIEERLRNRPRGIYLLRKDLATRGIQKATIEEYLSQNTIPEEEAALKCLAKKSKKWANLTKFQQKQKAYQYLQSRGFNFETIKKAVEITSYDH